MANPGSRSAYLDNVRSFVIFLVVAMHSNVTYSGIGGWYYTEIRTEDLDLFSTVVFGFYGSFTQAWFMGLMFFLGGFFASGSLSRRGAGHFVRERLFRLGVPLLVYVFLVTPFIGYALMNYGNIRSRSIIEAYGMYLSSLDWLGGTGPLWFAETLLAFSLVYVAVRSLRPAGPSGTEGSPVARTRVVRVPGVRALFGLILAIAACAFLVRVPMPVGNDVLNLQFPYFPSYIGLFAFGALAGERNWLDLLTGPSGKRWFALSLGAGIPLWGLLMVTSGALEGNRFILGGFHWQNAAYALWESFVALSFSLGILWLFRLKFDRETPVSRFFAANSFGVYMLHAPVLIALSLFLAGWEAPPLVKHLTVFPLAWVLTAGISAALRRIPPAAAVLR